MKALRLAPDLEPPVDHGRVLSAEQVANELLGGQKGPRWVRRHLSGPGSGKLVLGHSSVFWYENMAKQWIASHLDGA